MEIQVGSGGVAVSGINESAGIKHRGCVAVGDTITVWVGGIRDVVNALHTATRQLNKTARWKHRRGVGAAGSFQAVIAGVIRGGVEAGEVSVGVGSTVEREPIEGEIGGGLQAEIKICGRPDQRGIVALAINIEHGARRSGVEEIGRNKGAGGESKEADFVDFSREKRVGGNGRRSPDADGGSGSGRELGNAWAEGTPFT